MPDLEPVLQPRVAESGLNATLPPDVAVSTVAAAIGDRARARILMSLMDGRARTATELGIVAEVGASTTSVHLQRLATAGLVSMRRQGKHRYYTLSGTEVAMLLEGLSALPGASRPPPVCRAPQRLRAARTCYDHIAGVVGVALRERLSALGWLTTHASGSDETYQLSSSGVSAFTALGVDLEGARRARRRFAYGCLDWTERRYHLGGSLGAAFLQLARKRGWVVPDLDSRALRVTDLGRRQMLGRLGIPTP
jgi:DNA-binding transcriptional ArsR family regulator